MNVLDIDPRLCVRSTNSTSLSNIPPYIQYIECNNTQIRTIQSLPKGLLSLICSYTPITELPELPDSLTSLICHDTQLTALPKLPPKLTRLHCYNTPLQELPELPPTLEVLIAYNTYLTELPELPTSLVFLDCNSDSLILKRGQLETETEYNRRWRDLRERNASKKRIQERCSILKEELIAAAWHPRRVERWVEAGEFEVLDGI